ncbi:MAG: hypothetical protein K8R48_00050 [Alphaproteobacteria bacterium]|nr:hypothetical protein [Alphaproteobacteria bacterium]
MPQHRRSGVIVENPKKDKIIYPLEMIVKKTHRRQYGKPFLTKIMQHLVVRLRITQRSFKYSGYFFSLTAQGPRKCQKQKKPAGK